MDENAVMVVIRLALMMATVLTELKHRTKNSVYGSIEELCDPISFIRLSGKPGHNLRYLIDGPPSFRAASMRKLLAGSDVLLTMEKQVP